MNQNVIGQPYLVSLSSDGGAGGADVSVAIRPSLGDIWIVRWMYIHHDDNAANRDMRFSAYDGSTEVFLKSSGAVAMDIQHPYYYGSEHKGATVLTYRVYAKAYALTVGAGKKVYVYGLVERIQGVETEAA